MPLRKKHVRRIVLALLLALVLAPLVALTGWALWVRRGGMDAELERALEARLRCQARVKGLRPTGLDSALADEVALAWQTGRGRFSLRLAALACRRDSAGRWHVEAGEGRLAIEADRVRLALEAWNQRLVQTQPPAALGGLSCDAFTVTIASDILTAEESGMLGAGWRTDGLFWIELWPPWEDPEETYRVPIFSLAVDPASPGGVFEMAECKCLTVRPEQIVPALAEASAKAHPPVSVYLGLWWLQAGEKPPAPSAGSTINLSAQTSEFELADWTRHVPGGPITGRACLEMTYAKETGLLTVHLLAREGLISGETLRWLQDAVPTAEGCGHVLGGPIGYDALEMALEVGPDGRCRLAEGAGGPSGIVTTLFGEPVPLLWATGEAFDARAAWGRMRPALMPAAGPAPGPAAAAAGAKP